MYILAPFWFVYESICVPAIAGLYRLFAFNASFDTGVKSQRSLQPSHFKIFVRLFCENGMTKILFGYIIYVKT